jgi:ABC-2 type transport system permease protein
MSALTGAGKLARLILRRDRVVMPLWVYLVGLVPISYAASLGDLYPDAAARAQFAATGGSTAGFVALYGRLSGSSLGELVAWRAGFLPIVIGLFSLLTVIRHTRTEEDQGRRDLLGATVVGRHAALAAALGTTLAANLVLGAVLAAGLISQHLEPVGALAFGLEAAMAGWVFAAVGAAAAQLTESAGAARGIAVAVLGAGYALRVTGDLDGLAGGSLSWLSWASPFGLLQHLHPFGGERWWVFLVALALVAIFVVVAVVLGARRDVGAGLLPPRLGPATAPASLATPIGLAWRLHRGLLLAWTVGLALLGLVLGGAATSVGDLLRDNPQMQAAFARIGGKAGLIDAYMAAIMGILGLVVAGYAIQATLRMRAEESAGRLEPVLATAVGRLGWAASHLVFAALGPAVALAAAGAAAGLAYGGGSGDAGHQVARLVGAALVQLPAVWVLAAVALALIGLLPQLAAVSWGGLAVSVLVTLVGSVLQLSQWLLDVSPFTHVPKVPGAALALTPLVLLAAIAAALAGAGLAGLRRRDVPVG